MPTLSAMAKRGIRKDQVYSADSAGAMLIELVKFLARRAAERDDALSRTDKRTARRPGGKRDSAK